MKRIVILVILVILAGVAGVVVRNSRGGTISELRELVAHDSQEKSGDVRDEIRQSHELSPGARVEVIGINGAVKIETSATNKAEVTIERTASSQEALDRRKITIEANGNSLRIKGEKSHDGFFSRLFGSSASERVTLKLPRQISLFAKGVNGAVTSGEIEGPVEVSGINGKVQIAGATGTAQLKGINGSVVVGLKKLDSDVTLSGINGNIELQLGADVNADFNARGMNGRVTSDLQNVAIDNDNKRGHYSARIGSGGTGITAKGINGNIRFTR